MPPKRPTGRARRSAINDQKHSARRDTLLLFESTQRDTRWDIIGLPNAFLACRTTRGFSTLLRFTHPWKQPDALPTPAKNLRITAAGESALWWTRDEILRPLDPADSSPPTPRLTDLVAAFGCTNPARLACLSTRDISVLDRPTSRHLLHAPREGRPHLALDPAGRFLLAAGQNLALATIDTAAWTTWQLPGETSHRPFHNATDDPHLLALASPPRHESPTRVGWSLDGKWAWCGTEMGLHAWPADRLLVAQNGPLPDPTWSCRIIGPPAFARPAGCVLDTTPGPDDTSLLFSTVDGQILHMNLSTGRTRPILKLPEGAATRLLLHRPSQTLATLSEVAPFQTQGRRDQRSLLHLWNLHQVLPPIITPPNSP